eukprot:361375-Prymnesium_polylepis.1
MWVPDLGLSLRARPVWRPVQGPIARPPGFLPAPCGGVTAHARPAERPPPGYYRTRRKARCPIGTDRHVSPGRW